MNLKLPKAETKEWLKVLSYDEIMAKGANFSCAEKVKHLSILEEALERKLNKVVYLK